MFANELAHCQCQLEILWRKTEGLQKEKYTEVAENHMSEATSVNEIVEVLKEINLMNYSKYV